LPIMSLGKGESILLNFTGFAALAEQPSQRSL